MRTYQPEYALIARETREENRKQLADMLSQIATERAARLPPPPRSPVSLETQFQETIRKTREDIQRAKDVQAAHILRWLRS
ncbi:MAG: hypothetical protein ABSA41_21315 [Terriglobia bacterium]